MHVGYLLKRKDSTITLQNWVNITPPKQRIFGVALGTMRLRIIILIIYHVLSNTVLSLISGELKEVDGQTCVPLDLKCKDNFRFSVRIGVLY